MKKLALLAIMAFGLISCESQERVAVEFNQLPEKAQTFVKTHFSDKTISIIFHDKDLLDKEVLNYIDVLVDGEFKDELHDPKLKWCGSSNQRIIDVKKSLAAGKIILWEEFKFDLPEGPQSFGKL